MENRPLTTQVMLKHYNKDSHMFENIAFEKDIQSAKRLLKQKLPEQIRLGNNAIIPIHKEIDACFQIPDGDEKE